MNPQPTSPSPFEEPVGRVETRVQNWSDEIADCRQKLTNWEKLRSAVTEECDRCRGMSVELADRLQSARRVVTAAKFPKPASVWDRVPGRWLSLRWNWIRLQIVLLATLLFLRWLLIRLLQLAALAVVIAAVVWLAMQLYEWVQRGGLSGWY